MLAFSAGVRHFIPPKPSAYWKALGNVVETFMERGIVQELSDAKYLADIYEFIGSFPGMMGTHLASDVTDVTSRLLYIAVWRRVAMVPAMVRQLQGCWLVAGSLCGGSNFCQ